MQVNPIKEGVPRGTPSFFLFYLLGFCHNLNKSTLNLNKSTFFNFGSMTFCSTFVLGKRKVLYYFYRVKRYQQRWGATEKE